MVEEISPQAFTVLSQAVQKEVRKYSWFGQYGYEWLFFGLRALLFAGGLFIMSAPYWLGTVLGLIVASYAFYGIAITGTHESRHNAYVRSAKKNKILGFFFGDFWSGESSEWWYAHHVQDHHVYTNIYGKDEDYFMFPWVNRYLYLFILPYFVVPTLFVGSVKYLWPRKIALLRFLVLYFAGYAFQTALVYLAIGHVGWSLLAVLLIRSLFSPVFMHLALFNHIGLEKFEKKFSWLPHQSKTTRNVKPNWFLVGMGGNAFVHRHIEHHLFPSLPNRMLSKINPLVQEAMKKEGYTYIENTYSQCLRGCIKYYKLIFTKGPPPLAFK